MQWHMGPFRLDPDHASLWRGDERVILRPKPFDLLVYLVEHAGELVTKEDLLGALWPETVVAESALTVSVSELRKALGETARAPQYIATEHRRGYRFIAPVMLLEPPAPPVPVTTLEPTQVEAPEVPPPLAAERRQLTVLFCDLVDSTYLAGQLDPEDWREVLHAYHQSCAEVVERFKGYVAQYLGDGVLVYFGYPVAHEDDAQRAVWSGLGLLETLAALNDRLALPSRYKLAVRLGVHTGLVVVSKVGTGKRQEPLAQGETPHIAARLQNLAGPNELVISGGRRDLLGEVFRVKNLGEQVLQGVVTPIQVYRAEGVQAVKSRFEAMSVSGQTSLVGRDEERELLWRRWQQATEGEGQVVLLSGEAGLGKSRLAEALSERLADEPHLRVLYQGSPYHTNSAFYPIMAHLERTLQLDQVSLPTTKLDRLETLLAQAGLRVSEAAPLLASLLSIPSDERYAPRMLSSERQKERTMATWAELMVGLSQREPVLVVFEDVHWSDPTTLNQTT
jgi:class 3 adenylate cyclase